MSRSLVGKVQNIVLTTNSVPYIFAIQSVIPSCCRRATRGLVDAHLVVRYLKRIANTPMISGFVPEAENTPTDAANLENRYTDNLLAYGFNGDSTMSSEVDDSLYARYALGFRGAALFVGIEIGTARRTAQIECALLSRQ
jgi:hypothetical protein